MNREVYRHNTVPQYPAGRGRRLPGLRPAAGQHVVDSESQAALPWIDTFLRDRVTT